MVPPDETESKGCVDCKSESCEMNGYLRLNGGGVGDVNWHENSRMQLDQHETIDHDNAVDETIDVLVQELMMHRVGKVFDSSHPKVRLAEEVKLKGFPNVYGARIPVE